ncbi:hypothetical protein [Alicyclobacillus sp. ALC3]|uniref:hypothetical protein n=1 Tax=Alicyclobacillus sp. ALC3 TaxID=2796143 RepID=UPI0023794D0F|nr:hypothetical protein [Alicyclobacillus sp. ALC3]WDL96379.1 hypothetical protein JC200_18945 [Alicyclobacillus sp. ALC3]
MAIPSFEEMLREAARTLEEIQAHKQNGRPVASEATEQTKTSTGASVTQLDEGDNRVSCHQCGESFAEEETEERHVWNGLDIELWDLCLPCADEYDAMVEYESAMQSRGIEAVWR